MELFNGPVPVDEVLARWYEEARVGNNGAFITFVGTVRDEGGIEGLSFDIYEPILQKWFDAWQERAKAQGASVMMAHSIGDVPLHKSSYIAAVLSPKRKPALRLIEAFVEDFKANAPIWKYDLICGKRRFASDRATPMSGAGILGTKEGA